MALTEDKFKAIIQQRMALPEGDPKYMRREDAIRAFKKFKAQQKEPLTAPPQGPQPPQDNAPFFQKTQPVGGQPMPPQGNPEQAQKFAEELQQKVYLGQMDPATADRTLREFQYGSTGAPAPQGGMGGPFNQSPYEVPRSTTPSNYYRTEVPRLSLGERIADVFTGALRKTEQTEKLKSWEELPELGFHGLDMGKNWDALMAVAGTQVTSPDETVQILKSRFPQIETEKDEKGNWIIKSGMTGEKVAIKPGMTFGDIVRFGTNLVKEVGLGRFVSALFPLAAAKYSGPVSEIAKGASTEAVTQLSEYLAGGQFNLMDIGGAGAFQGAGKLLERGAKAKEAISEYAELASKSIEGDAGAQQRIATVLASGTEQEKQAMSNAFARMGFKADDVGKVTTGDVDMDWMLQYIAKTPPHEIDMNMVLGAFKKNPEFIKQAQDMDVLKYLLPAELVDRTDRVSRKIADASVDADIRDQNLMELAEDINQKISDAGLDATSSIGEKTAKMSKEIQDRIAQMEANTDAGYKRLYSEIGDARFDANQAMQEVQELIDSRGANTPPPGFKWIDGEDELLSTDFEREVIKALTPREAGLEFVSKGQGPTIQVMPKFTRLDTLRRKAGAMMKDPTFSTEAQGYAKRMYSILDSQAERALAEIGGASGLEKRWKTYKKSVEIRKDMEDNLIASFGKDLQKDLRKATESAVSDLSKGGQSAFINRVNALPKNKRGTYISDALIHTLANESSEKGFQAFGAMWDAVNKNGTIKNTLASNLTPQQMQLFEGIGSIAGVIRKSTKYKSTMSAGELLKIAQGQEAILGRLVKDLNTSIGTSVIVSGVSGVPLLGGGGSLGLSLGILNAVKRLRGSIGPDASKALEVLRSPPFRDLMGSELKDTDYMKFARSNAGKIWREQIGDTTSSETFAGFLRSLAPEQNIEPQEDR